MGNDGFLVGDGGEKGVVILLILHHHCGCSVFFALFCLEVDEREG